MQKNTANKIERFAALGPRIKARLVTGKVIAILGQFLPLKSVLVLYSGKVPSFFPNGLAALGPEVNALVLLLLGGAISLAGFTILKSSQVSEKTIGNYYLFPVLILVSFLISPIMTLAVFTYLAIVLLFSVRSFRKKPELTSQSEIVELSSRIGRQSIWVTSSAALITVLTWIPWSGLIGVLASAVLLNRSQVELKWLLCRLHQLKEGVFS